MRRQGKVGFVSTRKPPSLVDEECLFHTLELQDVYLSCPRGGAFLPNLASQSSWSGTIAKCLWWDKISRRHYVLLRGYPSKVDEAKSILGAELVEPKQVPVRRGGEGRENDHRTRGSNPWVLGA